MREMIETFDLAFGGVSARSRALLGQIPSNKLFWKPEKIAAVAEPYSAGELIIRSAAAVERAFGGITRRLWDDPFEWTLPEELSSAKAIAEYLDDVDVSRRTGIEFLADDRDLLKMIPAPEVLKPIAMIMLETLDRASHLQGRAFGVAQQFLRLRPYLP